MPSVPAAEKFILGSIKYDEYTSPLGITRRKVKFGIARFSADGVNAYELVFNLDSENADSVRDTYTYISKKYCLATRTVLAISDNSAIEHTAPEIVYAMSKYTPRPFGDYYVAPSEFSVVNLRDLLPVSDPEKVEWAVSHVREMVDGVIASSAFAAANRRARRGKRSAAAANAINALPGTTKA
jgi:hypothetical protein